MDITLHEDVKELLAELNEIGPSMVFGGYLRDRYFQRESSDVDIVTNIPIEVIAEKYANMEKAKRRMTTSGQDVFSFKMHRREKIFVEIVSVKTNLLDKSSQADYTINSMLHDGKNLIDSQNALKDIKEKTIREVDINIIRNDLNTRPFLWLKTLRLVSATGFDLTDETYQILNENKICIENISREIMQTEGHRTLNGKSPLKTMKLLSRLGFISSFVLDSRFEESEYSMQPQQKLCMLAVLTNKQTVDDYAKFYHFQPDLIQKYERLYDYYNGEERPPSRFRNQIIMIKKIIEKQP